MFGEPPTPPAPSRGVLPWLVGAFALWQLASLFLANMFEFVPLRQTASDIDPPVETPQRWGRFTSNEALQSAAETVGYALASWTELTGQEQGWNMFTPGFPPQTVVPAVELRFADGTTARAYSRFEPPDPRNPRPRWPLVHDREFNYEANIFMLAWHCTPQTLAERPDEWRALPEKVRENDSLLIKWLTWRVREFRSSHPDKQPVEAVLVLRCFPTPLPDNPSAPPEPMYERPFARLVLDRDPQPGELPLEGYDPVAGEWVRLKAWAGP
jgi:hypothetical protein